MTFISFLAWAIAGVAGCYALIVLVLAAGLARLPRSRALPESDLPRVSVLVSCRNEEVDLPRCLEALTRLDYPRDRLEILLVDDGSTDGTPALLADAARRHPHVRALSTAQAPPGPLKAKARGIAWAARHAAGEWLFITDADGAVPPGWLRHMLWGATGDVGIIGGMMVGTGGTAAGLLERVSWAFTLPFAFGMAGWGRAAIAVGPNMAIRKSVYDAAGGLDQASFTIAEDLALFRMAQAAGARALAHASPETTVRLTPVPSFRHLLSQQRRWLRGGFEGDWQFSLGLAAAFGYHFVLSVSMALGWFVSVPLTAAVWALKVASDATLLGVEASRTGDPGVLRFAPLSTLYSVAAFIWIPMSLAVTRTVHWQGEGYSLSYPGDPGADTVSRS